MLVSIYNAVGVDVPDAVRAAAAGEVAGGAYVDDDEIAEDLGGGSGDQP